MKVFTVGSINVDHVYEVDHFVRPGETLGSSKFGVFAGGKGFNQSVALARAGVSTVHVGRLGPDRDWLLELLEEDGVDTQFITVGDEATGHAIIQIVPSGENAILLYGGANQAISERDIDAALATCEAGDWLLTQNETSNVAYAIRQAKSKGMKVAFNPAPISDAVTSYPLDDVDLFILNETEAEGITGVADPDAAMTAMRDTYPSAATIITLGSKGAAYADETMSIVQPSTPVEAVDTTAAGDCFIGYFMSEFIRSGDAQAALAKGCKASAICVTRQGAAGSIPVVAELG